MFLQSLSPLVLLIYFLALVLIITVHECAHAWVAKRLGDPTADRMGRVSLNPLRHLDLIGTLMLFLVGIGWGKPVPVNSRNFKRPIRDEALTAFAGPTANLFLAVLAAFPVSYLEPGGVIFLFANVVLELSLVLFLFNMLPFPPLDGSKIVTIFISQKYQLVYRGVLQRSMPYFMLFVILDIYLLPKVLGFSIVMSTVSTATFWLKAAILVIV